MGHSRQSSRRVGQRRRRSAERPGRDAGRGTQRSASLRKPGWRPKRTIVYAAWDGEEEGLIGSTEWVETARRRAERKGGRLHQHRFERPRISRHRRFAHARKIYQRSRPRHSRSADENERLGTCARQQIVDSNRRRSVKKLEAGRTCGFRRTWFRFGFHAVPQHLGIASMNIGFGGEDGGGSYHSVYDSFDIIHPLWRSRISFTASHLPKVCGHCRSAARRMPTRCRSNSRILRIRSGYRARSRA